MSKVVTMGEIMLRLSSPFNSRFVQSQSFDVNYGGGEANVAVSLANYGHDAYFVSKVPAHEIGDCAVNSLRKFGVHTDYIARGGDRLGIYYLETGASMRPSKVIYDRAHSSISEANPSDFDFDKIFENADWFHWSGITPAISDKSAEILRLAFGINVLTDFLSPYKVLVEGYSDCKIIKKTIDRLCPKNCINITNGLGSKIISTAAMLKYYNVPVFTIVDADKDGVGYKSDIIKLGEPYTEDNVKTIKELSDDIISKGTIEDSLKVDFVVERFQKAFKKLTDITEWDFEYSGEKALPSFRNRKALPKQNRSS